jgi:hypothetical protein
MFALNAVEYGGNEAPYPSCDSRFTAMLPFITAGGQKRVLGVKWYEYLPIARFCTGKLTHAARQYTY